MLKIEVISEPKPVFDISVEDNQNFFANGALIHNCVEIALPTQPLVNKVSPADDESGTVNFEGMMQLCTLAAINLGNLMVDDTKDMEHRMRLLVRFLNEVLDYQSYMTPQAKRATMRYRPLGIGVINYAYLLAKNGHTYSDVGGHKLTHRVAEQLHYFALKASVELAAERGHALPGIGDTVYGEGKLLLDDVDQAVNELTDQKLVLDWSSLREQVKQHGTYNATLLALMPAESSSFVSNATNGVEPIRSLVTKKANKKVSFVQVAPEAVKLKNQYQYLWDMTPEDMNGYIRNMAIFQKFVCQAISTNLSYNPEHFPDRKIPLEVLINHFLLCAKLKLKTRYYLNTKGERDYSEVLEAQASPNVPVEPQVEEEGDGCESGACKL